MSGLLKILISFVIALLVLSSSTVFAQGVKEKADSISIYKNIQEYSGKNKITRFFYQLLFKPVVVVRETKVLKKKEYLKAPFKNLTVFLKARLSVI